MIDRNGWAAPAAAAVLGAAVVLAACVTPPIATAPDAPSSPVKPRPMIAGDPAALRAQNFAAIDERAASAPASASASMQDLVAYLVAGTTSEVERVRALWAWEATHVAYDYRSYAVGDIPRLNAEEVFIRRKGVCIDYSVLFERLAWLAGIPARTVTGKATGYPKSILLEDTLHAWNAVRIEGAWYLLDVTWSAGQLDEEFKFHATAPDTTYFLADPALFVRSHFPDDPVWQLLPRPISMASFLEMAGR